MKNKTILITGSTDGIGKQTAPELSAVTGKYFKNMKPTKFSRISYDAETRKRLLKSCRPLFHSKE